VRLGLIVNPIAGIGGTLALKGSDGDHAARALAAGAEPTAAARATQALNALAGRDLVIGTSAGAMGQDSVLAAGLTPDIVHQGAHPSGASDTAAAARALAAGPLDLLLFAGGDGTARDVLAALGDAPVPVLGIPAGVKMLSAVFATSPRAAGAALAEWLERGLPRAGLADVLDRDPDGGIRLYGALPAPTARVLQGAKGARDGAPGANIQAAARALAAELRAEPLTIVGPGATMMLVKEALAGAGTLLGVDAYSHGRPLALDAPAATLRELARATPPHIVLGVIGGQGFLLGRGNQQLPAALAMPGARAGLHILAAQDKLAALTHGALLVDSGDPAIDAAFEGHVRVTTGVRTSMMMRVRRA
jgi:predicted polyphosphate/ATP-dependent NAD kinase